MSGLSHKLSKSHINGLLWSQCKVKWEVKYYSSPPSFVLPFVFFLKVPSHPPCILFINVHASSLRWTTDYLKAMILYYSLHPSMSNRVTCTWQRLNKVWRNNKWIGESGDMGSILSSFTNCLLKFGQVNFLGTQVTHPYHDGVGLIVL